DRKRGKGSATPQPYETPRSSGATAVPSARREWYRCHRERTLRLRARGSPKPSTSLLLDRDVRARRFHHAGTDMKARMRRLVVARILRRDVSAVLRVVHQGVDAASGDVSRGVDAQRGAARKHDLFAPIAE